MDTPPVTTKRSLTNSITKTSLTPCRRLGLSRPSSSSLKKSLAVGIVSTPIQKESIVTSVSTGSPFPENKTHTDYKNKVKVPLKTSNVLNKTLTIRARRCLTKESNKPSHLGATRVLANCASGNLNSSEFQLDSEADNHSLSKLSTQDKKIRLDTPPELHSEKEAVKTCNNEDSSITVSDQCKNPDDSSTCESSQEITATVIKNLASSIISKKKRLEELKIQETYAKKHDLIELRDLTAKWRTAGQEALRHSVILAKQAGYSVTIKQLMTQHGFPAELMGYNSEDDEFD